MPGVQFKSNAPAPAPQGVTAATPVAPVVADAAIESPGAVMGTNDGQTITMPNVAAPAVPLVVGGTPALADDDADYEILHHRVGEFSQGDRVKADRFPVGTDFDRLLKLEAVKPLKDAAPADEPEKKKGK